MQPKTINGLCVIIMELCISVSSRTEADIFCNYSPHVQSFSIAIHNNGWEVSHEANHTESVYINHVNEVNVIMRLEKMIDEIKKIANEKGLVIK